MTLLYVLQPGLSSKSTSISVTVVLFLFRLSSAALIMMLVTSRLSASLVKRVRPHASIPLYIGIGWSSIDNLGRSEERILPQSLGYTHGCRRRVYHTSLHASNDHHNHAKDKKEELSRQYAIFKMIRAKDFEGAMELYDQMKDKNIKRKDSMLLALLSVCHKAAHLSKALEIVEEIHEQMIPHGETSYLTLVRCHADAGEVDRALELIREMVDVAAIEPRQRAFQPVLDKLSDMGDILQLLEVQAYMQQLGLKLRGEQIVSFLSTLGLPSVQRLVQADGETAVCEKLHELLAEAGDELLGLSTEEIIQIVSRVQHQPLPTATTAAVAAAQSVNFPVAAVHATEAVGSEAFTENVINRQHGKFDISAARQKVIEDGILVESMADIRSQIISNESASIDGSVVALNATFSSVVSAVDGSLRAPASNDPSIPVGQDATTVQLVPEKYVVLTEAVKAAAAITKTTATSKVASEEEDTELEIDATSRNAIAAEAELSSHSLKHQPARIVDISTHTGRCPNCDGEVLPLKITEEERTLVRSALHEIASARSANQSRYLENFGSWLRARPRYEYIVDAANVAYFNQNFKTGKFSYKQIELVVDKLLERSSRVLVIMPNCYARVDAGDTIPNSVRYGMLGNSNSNGGGSCDINRRRAVSIVTEEDKRILNKLESMMYVVPRGANDDWYWMYATMYAPNAATNTSSSIVSPSVSSSAKRNNSPDPAAAATTESPPPETLEDNVANEDVPVDSAYVVSNDLMRDHKIAFIEPKIFVRWRNSQITYFGLSRAIEDTGKEEEETHNEVGEEEEEEEEEEDGLAATVGGKDTHNPKRDVNTMPEVYLYEPGKFSREIQRGSGAQTHRWHIPSVDRSLWLCLNIRPSINSGSTGSESSSTNNGDINWSSLSTKNPESASAE